MLMPSILLKKKQKRKTSFAFCFVLKIKKNIKTKIIKICIKKQSKYIKNKFLFFCFVMKATVITTVAKKDFKTNAQISYGRRW